MLLLEIRKSHFFPSLTQDNYVFSAVNFRLTLPNLLTKFEQNLTKLVKFSQTYRKIRSIWIKKRNNFESQKFVFDATEIIHLVAIKLVLIRWILTIEDKFQIWRLSQSDWYRNMDHKQITGLINEWIGRISPFL
jgi:hypothetical protein